MSLVNSRRTRGMPHGLHGFGAVASGFSSAEISVAQAGLRAIGFAVADTGVYDAATTAAVLEFRGAAGMSYVDLIDEAFLERLLQEVDVAGRDELLTPIAQLKERVRSGDINITGRVGGLGLGLFGLLLVGYLATRKRRK